MCFVGWMTLAQPAGAVVVISGGPNNTAAGAPPFFENVGTLNSASAIYLGNGWVLTANHVASSLPGSVNFGGIGYATEVGSFRRLTNPDFPPALSTFTDIVLFRLSAPPALPGLEIADVTPTVGSQVTMMGNGLIQQSSPTFWNRTVIVGDNNDTWVEVPENSSNIGGFQTTGSREVRWGENLVNRTNLIANVGTVQNPIHVISITTQFNSPGLAQEAQAVAGDSGGAVFSFDGNSWELSGMMFAVSEFEMQPGGTSSAIFGQETAIADLSYYREEILSIIPEPSAAVLALLGGLGLFRRRR